MRLVPFLVGVIGPLSISFFFTSTSIASSCRNNGQLHPFGHQNRYLKYQVPYSRQLKHNEYFSNYADPSISGLDFPEVGQRPAFL